MNSRKSFWIVTAFALAFGLMMQPSAQARVAPLPTYKANAEDFFYAQQTSLWIFIQVPRKKIREQIGDQLDRLGFEIASFEDSDLGYLVVKPMVFTGEFGAQTGAAPGISSSTEVEFSVLVYPKGKGIPASAGTFADFLSGHSHADTIGQLRLDVLCDNEVAVAAGRADFDEHKFLGSFEYNYPTPNTTLGSPAVFKMDMTAYTWQGAGQSERKMFRIQADLTGLSKIASRFSSELLFSSSPPEPSTDQPGAVGEYRHYNAVLSAYLAPSDRTQFSISYGDAQGAEPLKPVPPYGDGKAISGSEAWPTEMRDRMRVLISSGSAAGYLLFQTPSSEYETHPFEIGRSR